MDELVGRGRDCDVFDAGPGRVLRRNRAGRSTQDEALTMRHLARCGYPVPTVYAAVGPDITMERLVGPTMLDDLARRPWKLRDHAALLAGLIDRLVAVPLPDHRLPTALPPVDGARDDRLAHMDLHPNNVVLTERGPVVIDWTNAAAAPPGLDAANTWLTLAAGRPDGSTSSRAVVAVGRNMFLWGFLRATDRQLAASQLERALAIRLRDPNQTSEEVAAMRLVVERST